MAEAIVGPWPPMEGYRLVFAAEFDASSLSPLRSQVGRAAGRCGLLAPRIDDFAIAVNEIMTNAVRHGGGSGELGLWRNGDLVCEISDDGHGFSPSAYLYRTSPPTASAQGGMGLWLAQQTTVELGIRSGTTGSTVRLRVPLSGRHGTRHGTADRHGRVAHRRPEDAAQRDRTRDSGPRMNR